MTTFTSPPRKKREQERFNVLHDNFFGQTVEENNERLNSKTTFQDLHDEIKFIEAYLLSWRGWDLEGEGTVNNEDHFTPAGMTQMEQRKRLKK